MLDIKAKVNKGQDRQNKGINAQSDDINKKEIKEFIKFKLFKYKVYKLKDNDLQETYHKDFSTFIAQTFQNYNQVIIYNLQQFL